MNINLDPVLMKACKEEVRPSSNHSLCSPASLSCVLEQDTFILAQYWFNPGRPIPTLLKNC